MPPRDYVLQSINHKQPEKLPLDLGGTPGSGISGRNSGGRGM
jgi:uroporphyrinogen decarboxylase